MEELVVKIYLFRTGPFPVCNYLTKRSNLTDRDFPSGQNKQICTMFTVLQSRAVRKHVSNPSGINYQPLTSSGRISFIIKRHKSSKNHHKWSQITTTVSSQNHPAESLQIITTVSTVSTTPLSIFQICIRPSRRWTKQRLWHGRRVARRGVCLFFWRWIAKSFQQWFQGWVVKTIQTIANLDWRILTKWS